MYYIIRLVNLIFIIYYIIRAACVKCDDLGLEEPCVAMATGHSEVCSLSFLYSNRVI